MSEYQIQDTSILENFKNGKFLKKDMRKVFKEICQNFGLNIRGYKEIELLGKVNQDGSIVFCHIGQWTEEEENNTFDYDLNVFDENGMLTYDESDGELPRFQCYQAFNECNQIKHYEKI